MMTTTKKNKTNTRKIMFSTADFKPDAVSQSRKKKKKKPG